MEAICQFFNTIGKQLDENPKSRRFNDVYFNRLKDLTTNSQLASRLRFMARDVLDLRSNQWVPRREEVQVPNFSLYLYYSPEFLSAQYSLLVANSYAVVINNRNETKLDY